MKRKYIPLATQLAVALRQLGLDPKTAQLHHDPALVLRKRRGEKYIPDENDPAFLKWLAPEPHAVETFGPGAEKRITTRGGDIHTAHRIERLSEAHKEFRRNILKPKRRRKPKRSAYWGKR